MLKIWFQHTAARRRLGQIVQHIFPTVCFNTQPPEGGWFPFAFKRVTKVLFQHTAARRRLVVEADLAVQDIKVSTHSRPKAAGTKWQEMIKPLTVSTHSRPKAAGHRGFYLAAIKRVSTHSRPKAAGG